VPVRTGDLLDASAALSSFWQELPSASWTNDDTVLTLSNGTAFLGNQELGRQLFYRPDWYRLLEDRISSHFDAGGRGIVVLGNPGRPWQL
jgi:hypothetical protein